MPLFAGRLSSYLIIATCGLLIYVLRPTFAAEHVRLIMFTGGVLFTDASVRCDGLRNPCVGVAVGVDRCLSVFVCLPACLSVCLSACLRAYLHACLCLCCSNVAPIRASVTLVADKIDGCARVRPKIPPILAGHCIVLHLPPEFGTGVGKVRARLFVLYLLSCASARARAVVSESYASRMQRLRACARARPACFCGDRRGAVARALLCVRDSRARGCAPDQSVQDHSRVMMPASALELAGLAWLSLCVPCFSRFVGWPFLGP